MAAWTVQRPSPESDTRPEKLPRSWLLVRALAVRSSSQEATTLPRPHTSVMRHRGHRAAHLQAEPARHPPPPAARPHVDVRGPGGPQLAGPPDVVVVVGVAPLDDHVVRLEQRDEILERPVHPPGRDHEPH